MTDLIPILIVIACMIGAFLLGIGATLAWQMFRQACSDVEDMR